LRYAPPERRESCRRWEADLRIAINGVGIAGPTLAYWLRRAGHDVLLIEEAPALRTGGYVVDFWGLGYDIAERMGLIPQIKELGYQVREVRFVGQDGRKTGGFPAGIFGRLTHGRFTSLRRSDLSALIYGALDGAVETLFGDSIVGIDQQRDAAHLWFRRAPSRRVDLVIGADGLHSPVREIVFGPQAQFEVPLGYHVAAVQIDGYRPRDELIYVSYAVPGRQVSRFAMRDDKTLVLFVFRDEYLSGQRPAGDDDRKSALAGIFANVGWECPRILDEMASARDIYFDRVSQIRMDAWARGRTVLVGDAAACVSLLAGEGTGLAMAEAYVLAETLRDCGEDLGAALTRYQTTLAPFLRRKQESAARLASAFVPRTRVGLAYRNAVTRVLGLPLVADIVIGRDLRDDFALSDYERSTARSG
jgi:2-polyprenyl-6-methoxyphenol hydroxylase-like FAD-dependent oxidoreductase